MHAPSLSDTWNHWRDSVSYALHPHPADPDHPSTRLADSPMRARLRGVRLLPLVIPGMALVLVGCALLIGTLLRS